MQMPPDHPVETPQSDKLRLVAFYLPQFHPIKENNAWWGHGFTEWTNVTRAKPLFQGHHQPQLPSELGFYDLRLRETRHEQIALARSYGIDAFCYYYYWFSGKRLLEAPLDDMLVDPASDMPFCLCWANENWSRRWNGGEQDILIEQQYLPEDAQRFIEDVAPFLRDRRYIRVDGKPILIVYRPQEIPDIHRVVDIWRNYCRSSGLGEIHLCAALTFNNLDYAKFGFDSGVEFPPHNRDKLGVRYITKALPWYRPFHGGAMLVHELARAYLDRDVSGKNIFRGVFPGWDNTARRNDHALLFLNGTPGNYEFWLDQAIKKTRHQHPDSEQLVFINAWNEWAEGCHLEPDQFYERDFLAATLRAKKGESQLRDFPDTVLPKGAVSGYARLWRDFGDDLRKHGRAFSTRLATGFQTGLSKFLRLVGFRRPVADRTPKLLVLAHDSALYGAQHSLLELLLNLDKARFNVHVVVPCAGAFTVALKGIGIKCSTGLVRRWIYPPRSFSVSGMLLKPWRMVRLRWHPYLQSAWSLIMLPFRVLLLAALVKLTGIRMIYTNTATLLEGALVSALCRVPHIWHLREPIEGNVDLENPLPWKWISMLIQHNTAVVITNSHALRSQMFGTSPPSKVRVVHNGVDIARFQHAPPSQSMAGLSEDVRLVAICGAIQERKDVMTFIRAAERLMISHPEVHYLIIGKTLGPYYEGVAKEIANRGLEKLVHCIGYREDIPEIFARIDILVSAASQEPFGRTIIEAMAAGKPVVSTRSGGPEEIIEDGRSGYLVDVGDDAAMGARLAELLSDPKKMQSMGAQARLRVEGDFNLTNTVQRIEMIFDEVLNATK